MYLVVEGRSWAVDIAQLVERSPAQGLGFDPQYHRKWYGGACLYCQHSRETQGSEVQGHTPEQRVRNQPERHENLYDKNLYLCLTHTHTQRQRGTKRHGGRGMREKRQTDRLTLVPNSTSAKVSFLALYPGATTNISIILMDSCSPRLLLLPVQAQPQVPARL